jgi:hypothetical protein
VSDIVLTVMTSAMTGGWRILPKGQYKARHNAMTIAAWMMNRMIGLFALYFAGSSPSKIPACGGALAAAVATTVAATVDARAIKGLN